ncbi:MAG: ABC transporter permease [Gemmatimonadetes bacterium]|nr:ABC transporter permease [Gemmatimonadota bacterium]
MSRRVDLASVGVGLETLRVNPLRTVLSTLGVIIGVASLIAILSMGDGMERFARSEIERTTGVQMVTVSPRLTDTIDGLTFPKKEFTILTAADAQAAEREIPGISGTALELSGQALVTPPQGRKKYAAIVSATLASALEFRHTRLEAGRSFTEVEAGRNAPVAVVSHLLAARLAGNREPAAAIGQTVRLNGVPRRVIGVLAPRPRERVLHVLVPLRAAAGILHPVGPAAAPALEIRARSVEEVQAVQDRVEDWLAGRYGRWEERFLVGTSLDRVEQVQRQMTVFKLFMGAVAAISLLVGGIGIMNVLLASVTERTHEIGIRKAAGARGRDIRLQFLAESVAISGAGSAVGVVLGLLGAVGISAGIRATSEAPLYPWLSASTVLVAAVSALTVGLTFGMYPAARAARLSPIDAIRHE